MTEEDEVDILGDFTFTSNKNDSQPLSSYSELLQCDYSVHPQWLLDTATPPCWYDTTLTDDLKSDTNNADSDGNPDSEPSTSKRNNEWTKSERDLLHKGLETYGHDIKRLAKFVGSKTSYEVQTFIEMEYGITLETAEPDFQADLSDQYLMDPSKDIHYGEILTENEIPASMEEVICMVSTAEPTIISPKKSSSRSLLKISQNNITTDVPLSITNNINFNRELPKTSTKKSSNKVSFSPRKDSRFIKDSTGTRQLIEADANNYLRNSVIPSKKSKFNISLTISKSYDLNKPLRKKKKRTNSGSSYKKKHEKDDKKLIFENNAKMEIITGSGRALPMSEGEQLVMIDKNIDSENESDVVIDIDSDSNPPLTMDISPIKPILDKSTIKLEKHTKDSYIAENNPLSIKIESDLVADDKDSSKLSHDIPSSVKNQLLSLDTPTREHFVDPTSITDLEKFLYPEFFEGRPSKTPMRYLIIRSHLISSWNKNRPQYLTKTTARHGLKNCGDVNCIGRIHLILEQIGAINFGCEQTQYIRPLISLRAKSESSPCSENKVKVENTTKIDVIRPRKKKLIIDGEGGYTITHSEYGEILESVSEPKPQRAAKKKPISLLYCKNFSEDHPAPYCVQIALSALILMDFHAHTSRAEVMGLLGGHHLPSSKIVTIEKYVPCDSLEDSGTHCDMCPVSQSMASESLSVQGLETVGWHHSHPLFPPQPSAQDILSQADLQNVFSPQPFLAIIMSPYWPPGRTASQYCCLLVREGPDVQHIAYKFRTNLHCDIMHQKDVNALLQQIQDIWDRMRNTTGNFALDMKNDICSDANISYLDKCISSISHHLNSCKSSMNTVRCTSIIDGINRIVR